MQMRHFFLTAAVVCLDIASAQATEVTVTKVVQSTGACGTVCSPTPALDWNVGLSVSGDEKTEFKVGTYRRGPRGTYPQLLRPFCWDVKKDIEISCSVFYELEREQQARGTAESAKQ